MLEATACELESSKAEASIKTSDLQALSSALSEAEERHAAAASAAASADAAFSETISKLEVRLSCQSCHIFLRFNEYWAVPTIRHVVTIRRGVITRARGDGCC